MLIGIITITLKFINRKKYLSFVKQSENVETVQRQVFKDLQSSLKKDNISYEEFKAQIPVSNYDDWASDVDEQIKTKTAVLCPDCTRYQPTSGSSGKRKLIPYSKKLLSEFDNASSVWIYEILERYSRVIFGKQYWSLSWLPDKDRADIGVVDDSELFGFWKKIIMKQVFCVPKKVSFASSSIQSMRATALYLLACHNLRLISVWSPTFLSSLINLIIKEKKELSEILINGKWKEDFVEISGLKAPKNKNVGKMIKNLNKENEIYLFQRIWPKLTLISCWDTGLSHEPSRELKRRFPTVSFQGKGLWSTEAVVTIPLQNKYVLAYQSHFYEFENCDSGEILSSWQLEKGMTVMPIVSTGSGFLRYKIDDVLLVDDFFNTVPCFTFLGRKGHVDMVGEKLDQYSVSIIIKKIMKMYNINVIGLLACRFDKMPFYLLLVDWSERQQEVDIESYLFEFFHYRLARELGQLAKSKVIYRQNASELYIQLREVSGSVRGNIKTEAITLVEGDVSRSLLSV